MSCTGHIQITPCPLHFRFALLRTKLEDVGKSACVDLRILAACRFSTSTSNRHLKTTRNSFGAWASGTERRVGWCDASGSLVASILSKVPGPGVSSCSAPRGGVRRLIWRDVKQLDASQATWVHQRHVHEQDDDGSDLMRLYG